MQTVLEKDKNGNHVFEVPSTIIGLYSLKEGQIFQVRVKEGKNVIIITFATNLH